MTPADPESERESPDAAIREIAEAAERKRRARARGRRGVWFGFGMFGLIGWAVAVPTLAGVALGAWIDRRVEGEFSWTLALLLAGVALGCLNALYWVSRESRHD